MAKTKYYAVKKGNKCGIFENWNECKESIKEYSGAEYKSFSSYDEAQAYLEGIDLNTDLIKKNQEEGFCTIFCDGSYKKTDTIENYSGAFILITVDGKESSQNFINKNTEFLSYHNVSGEILAALSAVENAISFEQDKIRLYYDYEGIEKWVTGEWKSSSDLSKFYIKHMNDLKQFVQIEFVKVVGHTNNSLNEQVDQLAKDALVGNKVSKKIGVNYMSISNVSSTQHQELIQLINTVESINIKNKTNNNEKIQDEIIDLKGSKVSITYFKTSRAILVQGDCNKFPYQFVLTYINEFFEDVKIERMLNQSYERKIDMTNVSSLEKVIPNLPKDYPKGISKLLKQSLINLKYHFEAEDYSMYSFPALRALEGHIKYLLKKNGYQLSSPFLDCFVKDGRKYKFSPKDDQVLQENVKWNIIEGCYGVYANSRHPLFHYGSIIGFSDDTKIMSSFDECEEMIQKVFAIIQESL